LKSSNALDNKGLPPANPPEPKAPSRWARASREDLEALAEALDNQEGGRLSPLAERALGALRASCPPLRTEAEVAAEALAILQQETGLTNDGNRVLSHSAAARLAALAKEPTR
jgi:hypothetical protein